MFRMDGSRYAIFHSITTCFRGEGVYRFPSGIQMQFVFLPFFSFLQSFLPLLWSSKTLFFATVPMPIPVFLPSTSPPLPPSVKGRKGRQEEREGEGKRVPSHRQTGRQVSRLSSFLLLLKRLGRPKFSSPINLFSREGGPRLFRRE